MALDWGAASGAVSDLLGSKVTKAQGRLKAQGMHIEAQGTRIGAQGTRIGAQGTRITAQGTRLGAQSLRIKAQGDLAEASNYDLAAGLARENAAYAKTSDEVKEFQLSRQINQTTGGMRADVAAAGFGEHGSAVDLLRDSASQGALAQAVLGQQGLITEAGYDEQAKSYDTMAAAGRMAAAGETDIAAQTDVIAGRQDEIANQQDVLAGRQDAIAGQQDLLGIQTQQAADKAAKVQQVTGVMKAVSFVAGIFGSAFGGPPAPPAGAPGGGDAGGGGESVAAGVGA